VPEMVPRSDCPNASIEERIARHTGRVVLKQLRENLMVDPLAFKLPSRDDEGACTA